MTEQRETDTHYVVFATGGTGAWWDAFCSPAFRHVWLLKPTYSPRRQVTATRSTIKIEPMADYLDFQHWPVKPEEAVAAALARPEVTLVIAVRVETPPRVQSFPRGLRGLSTCVSLIKYVMGVYAWSVWTPKQLCDYLLAHRNGIVLTEGGENGRTDRRRQETETGSSDCGTATETASAAR